MLIESTQTLSAWDARHRIKAGALSCESLVRQYLACIDRTDPAIEAWAYRDAEGTLEAARRLDRSPARGALHGIPVAIKDLFDTRDMPTGYGSAIYANHRPAADSATVALIRRAGGLIMGKTVTTEFAFFEPGKTRNPHDPARTPGGSSSGSAAAVAAGMVPLAVGTQTAGSVIRPASYCGVVGYKPTYGLISPAGVKAAAWSLDTIGVFARTVADAALLTGVLSGRDLPSAAGDADQRPRFGLCHTPQWDAATKAARDTLEAAAEHIKAAGGHVQPVVLPRMFDGLLEAQHTIMAFEAARCLAYEYDTQREYLSARLAELLESGNAIPAARYDAALRLTEQCRAALIAVYDHIDVLLAPSAPGEAPACNSGTGDPVFNRIWTLLGVPCVNVPGLTGPAGLPVGVQVIGPWRGDTTTLSASHWLATVLETPGPWPSDS